MNNLKYKITFICCAVILGISSSPGIVLGADATMSIAPPVGTFHVYEDVTLRILVSSDNKFVKIIEGRLTYDPKMMTITHVITSDSPLSFSETPLIDAELGEISFSGYFSTSTVLDRVRVLSIRVRPERVGEMRLNFESGNIGEFSLTGDNLLTGFNSGKFRIEPEELSEDTVGVASGNTRGEPTAIPSLGEVLGLATVTPTLILTSKTHPDQDAWYAASSSVFEIRFPFETDEIKLGYDKRALGSASVRYAPPIVEKTITNLEDGVSYFHASINTKNGVEEAHYRLQVDRRKPTDVTFVEMPRVDIADPNIVFSVSAKDFPSGISSYHFSVDDGPEDVWRDDGTHRYGFRANAQGVHKIAMTVFDKAGNSVKKELTFEVGYLLEPTLALYGDAPEEGRTQRINVTATPNSDVSIVTMHSGEVLMTEKVRTNSTGGAIFVSSVALSLGEYKVWATAHDDRGAVSRRSNEVLFTPDPSFFGMISRNPGVPIAMLAVLLLFFFLRRVLSGLREELNAEAIMLGQQEGQGAVVRVGKPEQATFDVLASPVEQVILRKKE